MKSDSQETSNPTKDEEENKYILGNDVENFFDSLFNRGGHPNVDRRYLKTTVPDDNESVTLKLINSKLVCYPKKEYKIPPPNDNESYEYYIPGVKGSTSILFPAFSSLNVKEQNILYRYHSLMFYNVRVLTEQETAEFKELMNKANIDYPAYQSFVYNQWIHLHAPRVRQIPPGVKLYTEYLWHTKAEQCLQLFPNYYKTFNSTIPLTLNDPHKAYAVMDFVRHVFVKGTPARMSLPSVKSPCELLTDFRDLCKIKPVAVEDKDLRVNPVIRQRVPKKSMWHTPLTYNREVNVANGVHIPCDYRDSSSGANQWFFSNCNIKSNETLPYEILDNSVKIVPHSQTDDNSDRYICEENSCFREGRLGNFGKKKNIESIPQGLIEHTNKHLEVPGVSIRTFSHLMSWNTQMTKNSYEFIVMGDFNISVLNVNSPITKRFAEFTTAIEYVITNLTKLRVAVTHPHTYTATMANKPLLVVIANVGSENENVCVPTKVAGQFNTFIASVEAVQGVCCVPQSEPHSFAVQSPTYSLALIPVTEEVIVRVIRDLPANESNDLGHVSM
ncbi:hypothetical protein J6590_016552 [Homalodisca vitripennis]|nr:hypothetical protein J6590_016552 [Homalodisca vitripennis]